MASNWRSQIQCLHLPKCKMFRSFQPLRMHKQSSDGMGCDKVNMRCACCFIAKCILNKAILILVKQKTSLYTYIYIYMSAPFQSNICGWSADGPRMFVGQGSDGL